jgi:hypothetical protein
MVDAWLIVDPRRQIFDISEWRHENSACRASGDALIHHQEQALFSSQLLKQSGLLALLTESLARTHRKPQPLSCQYRFSPTLTALSVTNATVNRHQSVTVSFLPLVGLSQFCCRARQCRENGSE